MVPDVESEKLHVIDVGRLVAVSEIFLKVLAFLFVGSAFVVIGSRLLKADFESRPTVEYLKAANSALVIPGKMRTLSEGAVSKFTFIAFTRSAESDLSVDEVNAHFTRLAERSGWKLSEQAYSKRRSRMIFCAGIVAHDIEISSRDGGGTSIEAGSYWFADKGDDRFCR